MSYTYTTIKALKLDGDQKVKEITVIRTPVQRLLTDVINYLSLGKLAEVKEKLNYDELYHLFIVVKLETGEIYLVEKNANIVLTTKIRADTDKTEKMEADNVKVITLNDLLENTRKIMGDDKFYRYDSFNSNCQTFILNVIRANTYLPSKELIDFIKQNLEDTLQPYVSKTANFITDSASKLDHFIQNTTGLNLFKNGGLVKRRKNRKRTKYI